ncbi:glycoside hydrolase family 16 protein [Modestobacter sp. URMC 112]
MPVTERHRDVAQGAHPVRRSGHRSTWVVVAVLVAAVMAGTLTVGWKKQEGSRWHPLLQEDFSEDVPVGEFTDSSYRAQWNLYHDGWADTSGTGTYAPSRVLSAEDGRLRFDMHFDNGEFLGAALVAERTHGQRFGRYTIRWRADPVAGYGLAFLLWPDSDAWPHDGEIDFPEGRLTGTIKAYAHHADANGEQDQFDTHRTMEEWQTTVIEWTPKAVTFYLDGELVGSSTTAVPQEPMHLVLQAGTATSEEPPEDARGFIEVDWVRVESYGA